jgi:RHS repeat-associated protein
VSARYEYGPFAEPIRVTGPAAPLNPFRFSTKRTGSTTELVLYEYRVYSATMGKWANRDPINEPGFNLLIHSQNLFNWDEEKNLYGFVHNDPMNLVDADGRVPVVAMFFYGNAIGNIGIACYSCKKLDECLETAKKYTQRAGEKLDPEKFQEWIRAAKPGSECIGLAEDCGVRVISATFWVAGRLLILRYLATK